MVSQKNCAHGRHGQMTIMISLSPASLSAHYSTEFTTTRRKNSALTAALIKRIRKHQHASNAPETQCSKTVPNVVYHFWVECLSSNNFELLLKNFRKRRSVTASSKRCWIHNVSHENSVGFSGCYGDSGGGLACYDQKTHRHYLHAIFSFILSDTTNGPQYCMSQPLNPNYYTKVSSYLPWLIENVPGIMVS